MASLAKATIVGNLGRDPETRYTPNGKMNVDFSVAVNNQSRDQHGNSVTEADWYRVTAWGKLAETLNNLTQQGGFIKGTMVLVTGRQKQRQWTAQDGTPRFSVEINADEVLLLSRPSNQQGQQGQQGYGGGYGAPAENEPF